LANLPQGSAPEVIAKHLGAPPPSLRAKVPDLPAEVEQVLMTALAKDPKARFGSVQAFANALKQASNHTAIQTASPDQAMHLPTQSVPVSSIAAPTMTASTFPQPPLETPVAYVQGNAQGYNPVIPPAQPFSPYDPYASPPPVQPLYQHQARKPEIKTALTQALICGAMLVAADIILIIMWYVAFSLIFPSTALTGSQIPTYLTYQYILTYILAGIHLLIDAAISFFAGRRTARKTGKMSMALLACLSASVAYLVLDSSYDLIVDFFTFRNNFLPALPYILLSMAYYIVPALLLITGLGALGGAIGRKRATGVNQRKT
jgi:cation transport ATPase